MSGPTNFHPEQNLQPLDCGQCEALFTEMLDQADGVGEPMDPVTTARFEAHVEGCAPCSGLFAEARRGHEWLRILQQEPVAPPVDLFSRILAKTSLAATPAAAPSTAQVAGQPVLLATLEAPTTLANRKPWQNINLVAMANSARRTLGEPRFLLTAAMAFFSITLTFNLLGVHITQVRPADLKPGNLRRSISRTYTESTARVTRYYDNLRIVYEFEARVREFRRNADVLPEGGTRKQESKPAPNGPSSQRDNSNGNDHVAGQGQSESPKSDESEPALVVDASLREVALRTLQARHNTSNENLKLQASCPRRLV